ncbi:class I SAM-dependent methyltransferase [Bradyrhizobium sp. 177]|uniref:class I SAM-dependent methyltransferase n=1 Tax=Bradyrhizobium sp. 177 TaxID=2782647 RepID=UPI001FFB8233
MKEIMSERAITDFYTEGYYGERLRQGQEVNAKIALPILQNAINMKTIKSALDIGSGYGFLLSKLSSKYSIAVTGVELAKAEAEYSRKTLGITTYSDLADIERSKQFDLVTMLEVIEHIPNPRDFVSAAAALVRPGGYLVIGTDNFDSSVVKTLGPKFPKWIPHQHVSLFTHETLPILARLKGFDVFALRSYTPWELTARAFIHRCSRGRGGARDFDFSSEVATENSRRYKYFGVRRTLSPLWARLTVSIDLTGEMMMLFLKRIET